jgi:CBS domain-containing protein
MTLGEVMHVHIPTLEVESTFREAVDKMDIYQFPALVIVDIEKRPVAVVTEGDLARAANAKGDVTGLAYAKVLDFATRQPITADIGEEVSEALHRMLTRGLSVLPVVHETRLSGIVLRADLMQALLMDVATPLPEPSE